MKNSKEILGNLIIAGGLLTAAKAGADLAANKAFWKEGQQQQAITAQVDSEYTMESCDRYCPGVVSGVGMTSEERNILQKKYNAELEEKLNAVRDPIAEKSALIDLGIAVGGLLAAGAGAGAELKEKKETK